MKTGVVDVGGGLRGVYAAGVFDYCLDMGIQFDFCIGVSAGSVNVASYIAGQKKRNYMFYTEYPFRKEYMSIQNFLLKKSYIDMEYLYGTLSNSTGENPLDYQALKKSRAELMVVATNAETGEAVYFNKYDLKQDDYSILKASSSIPYVCKPYEIDGVVLKVNNLDDEEELGYTARVPRWGIAYKFPAEEVLTTLKEIKFTVGRTGKITPNAIFSPVHVAGSLISKATLHNEDYCIAKDVRVGDTISIRKAGDVIPEVVRVLKERRNGTEKEFTMIENCPICNTKLIRKQTEADYYCPNALCPARKIENIIHFAEREAMNIDGMGESVIEDLYNEGFITDVTDIYDINKYEDELMNLEGYGTKKINNLKTAIEKSKSNSLERLLYGLGIRNVGAKTAKVLARYYKTLDNLMNASIEELTSINDIGSIIATSIREYFDDENNKKIINKLKEYGINTTYINNTEYEEKEEFKNKTFVLTGSLINITREEASKIIEDLGGKVSSSVSSKTSVVIVGDSPGSKYDKALSLNIPIWNEEEFLEKINN